MNKSAASRLGPRQLAAALRVLPDGVAVFAADWTIAYVNPAGAALLGRSIGELADRNIWIALPELAGTIFHTFLLHARRAVAPVTWSGFYAPAGRWLSATAVVIDGLLHLSFRQSNDRLLAEPATAGSHASAEVAQAADRERLRFLAEVSESLITTLDSGETAARLAELVVPRLADWAVLALLGDEGAPGEEVSAHADPVRRSDLRTYVEGRLRGTGDTALLNVLLTGEPVQVRSIDEAQIASSLPNDVVRAAWRRLNATSGTVVPLRARGETFGVLALMAAGGRSPLSEVELATAVEVARRGGLALDNARLYGRQLKVAETLQRSLLTPPPQPDGLQIAVRYRPAASYQQVGGDWYDAFTQPDGATLLVIGDVVGHNMDAAAAMGQIRSILRGIACDRPGSPAQTLTRVDRVLSTLGVETLATALVARIEGREQDGGGSWSLRWSSAGHLPPLLLSTAGTVRVLTNRPERLLGTGTRARRTDHALPLHEGETVLFITDGLVEHGHTGIDEGLARLADVLADLKDMPLEELCDQLLDRIVTHRSDDDIALLAVRGDRRPSLGRDR